MRSRTLLLLKQRNLEVNSFSQTLGAELLTNGSFATDSDWTKGAGWTIAAGVASHTGASTSLSQPTAYDDLAWYEAIYTITAYTTGSMRIGVGGNSLGTSRSAVGTFWHLLPYKASSNTLFNGDMVGSIDNGSVKKINLNPVWGMPSVNGTHTFTFTLPASPVAGQQIEMRYRQQDSYNFWACVLTRNAANTAWTFTQISVSAGTVTTRITVADAGTPDALRAVTSGNAHDVYTGVGGVFTKRNGTITSASLATQPGITAVYHSVFTPLSLVSVPAA